MVSRPLRSINIALYLYFISALGLMAWSAIDQGQTSGLPFFGNLLFTFLMIVGSIFMAITGFEAQTGHPAMNRRLRHIAVGGVLLAVFPLFLLSAILSGTLSNLFLYAAIACPIVGLGFIGFAYQRIHFAGSNLTARGAYNVIGAVIVYSILVFKYHTPNLTPESWPYYHLIENVCRFFAFGGIFALLYGSRIVANAVRDYEDTLPPTNQ